MEKKRSASLILVLVLILYIFPAASVFGQESAEDSFARQQAIRLLEQLSPAERIGQLFLVTFDGAEIVPDSALHTLIVDYHIGGVIFHQQNGNIPEGPNSGENLRDFIADIQYTAFSRGLTGDEGENPVDDHYLPLFIGVSQQGGSYPYDEVYSGLASIPSQMAIGATWDLDLALNAGEILGSELESTGFNLLLGPSMDVLDSAYTIPGSSLGVRSFGGDPYWVGKMGAQFISGLHRGSGNRLAVIARNFPGRGSTDRLPDEEVSTVRKSLEQLKLIELAPFFQITQVETAIPSATADGLVTSHIRYQGLQGNIRATTKPVSFDQNAIELLMSLSPLKEWREEGGILVSDDLGSLAINKFFNPNGQFIDGRQVVKNAFLAGNDILYMDELQSTGDADRFTTYRNTIDFFKEKYDEDAAFAEKVDKAAIRILTIKYELYSEFTLEKVITDGNLSREPHEFDDLNFRTAQWAATLINPTQGQLAELIPAPPQFSDRIIIFSNRQIVVPCENCEAIDIFPVNALQKSILKLYGPEGSGQINANRLVSYSFRDLADYLNLPINRPEIEENLSEADWVIFAIRERSQDDAGFVALQQMIAENQVLLREKKVIVFAFDAPYLFDATEISAFTAYYGLFSKLSGFVDVAARILFQEIVPISASPVSIPGIGYDLIEIMTPDPNQVIPLGVDLAMAAILQTEPQPESSPLPDTPVFKLGDTLPVLTGVIIDHNGNQVPDGTIVTFTMGEQGDDTTIQQVATQTKDGIANASFSLLHPGMHEIKVMADPALNSEILLLDISEEEATVSEIIPTPVTPAQIMEENHTAEEFTEEEPASNNPKFAEWILSTLLSMMLGAMIFFTIRDYFLLYENFLVCGTGIIGGLISMIWMIFELPGTYPRAGANGFIRMGLVVLLGEIVGALCGWMLLRFRVLRLEKKNSEQPKSN